MVRGPRSSRIAVALFLPQKIGLFKFDMEFAVSSRHGCVHVGDVDGFLQRMPALASSLQLATDFFCYGSPGRMSSTMEKPASPKGPKSENFKL